MRAAKVVRDRILRWRRAGVAADMIFRQRAISFATHFATWCEESRNFDSGRDATARARLLGGSSGGGKDDIGGSGRVKFVV